MRLDSKQMGWGEGKAQGSCKLEFTGPRCLESLRY